MAAAAATEKTIMNSDTTKNVVSCPDSEGDSLYHESWHAPFLPFLLLVPMLLPLFWEYHVTVTSTQLAFGYSWGITRESLSRDAIATAESVETIYPLAQWGGWGIRKNLKWETGYIGKNGPGIKVTTVSGYVYVFNCNEPKKVCKMLLMSVQ